ncbi:MAG: cytochrome b N-terminal domain-containing protein [Candidatus Hydrothermarchaeales archaeon]
MMADRTPENWYGLKGWIDERYFKFNKSTDWQSTFDSNLDKTIYGVLRKPIPDFTTNPMYCLGGIALTAFLIQLMTGPLLAMYYRPTPDQAYESVVFITTQVYLGNLIRGMHHWGANFMMAAVSLHMLRVFFTGAYKKPRELTWLMGLALLALTLTQGLTGYVLPWNQLGYWATNIVVQIAGSFPVVGPPMAKLAQAGDVIGGKTLTRFYILHVLVIPGTLVGLLGLKFAMIRRQAISGKRDPDFVSGGL